MITVRKNNYQNKISPITTLKLDCKKTNTSQDSQPNSKRKEGKFINDELLLIGSKLMRAFQKKTSKLNFWWWWWWWNFYPSIHPSVPFFSEHWGVPFVNVFSIIRPWLFARHDKPSDGHCWWHSKVWSSRQRGLYKVTLLDPEIPFSVRKEETSSNRHLGITGTWVGICKKTVCQYSFYQTIGTLF